MEEIKDNNGGEVDNFAVGQGEAKPVAEDIAQRLGQQAASEAAPSEVAEAANAVPFDISKLSKEQLQSLKAMLEATPSSQSKKKLKPRVKVRFIDGQYVIDFRNAYLGLVKDSELNRDVERHIIPVKFLGAADYVPVLYKKFIESEQVPCEVVSQRTEPDEEILGETFSREEGRMVEMVRRYVDTWFTIKLPDGVEVEIQAKVANG